MPAPTPIHAYASVPTRRSARVPLSIATALIATLVLGTPPALAQGQSADLEYYVQPDSTGVNLLTVTTDGMSLVNDLSGVTLTFSTGGFFEREFVARGDIEFAAEIDVTVQDFGGAVPTVPTDLAISTGRYRLSTPQGEIIEGDLGNGSMIRVVPYPPAPRVLFFEMTLVPTSTLVTPAQSATLSMDEIKTWGLIVTDGQGFSDAFGYAQNQQYGASAEF